MEVLFFLFLVGCAVIYMGTIEAAFGSMVRLSERLNAERWRVRKVRVHRKAAVERETRA